MERDVITISSSDEEDVIETQSCKRWKTASTTSNVIPEEAAKESDCLLDAIPAFFKEFVVACKATIKDQYLFSVIDETVAVLRVLFRNSSIGYGASQGFRLLIEDASRKLRSRPGESLRIFLEVFTSVKKFHIDASHSNQEMPKALSCSENRSCGGDPDELPEFYTKFIKECIDAVDDPRLSCKMRDKSAVLFAVFKKTLPYGRSAEFKQIIEDFTSKLLADPKRSIIIFHGVFQHLNDVRTKRRMTSEEEFLFKLRRLLEKYDNVIQRLEQEEVNFDEEDDSSYIKMQSYRSRAHKVHLKIESLENGDPYKRRIYHSALVYDWSKYAEINRAITEKFQSRFEIEFPTFKDVHRCVKRCAAENPQLRLSKGEIRDEAESNFVQLGNVLQRKRKEDMYQIHCESFLGAAKDPAEDDLGLESKLRENKRFGEPRMNDALQRFTEAVLGLAVVESNGQAASNRPE